MRGDALSCEKGVCVAGFRGLPGGEDPFGSVGSVGGGIMTCRRAGGQEAAARAGARLLESRFSPPPSHAESMSYGVMSLEKQGFSSCLSASCLGGFVGLRIGRACCWKGVPSWESSPIRLAAD